MFSDPVSPTLLNALAGFLTTIVSLYTAHDGDWSIMVLLTVIASGLSIACSLILIYFYKFDKLQRLKQEHDRIYRDREPPLQI
jgi:NADH:ubiquinone oxidoreductase subunit K